MIGLCLSKIGNLLIKEEDEEYDPCPKKRQEVIYRIPRLCRPDIKLDPELLASLMPPPPVIEEPPAKMKKMKRVKKRRRIVP